MVVPSEQQIQNALGQVHTGLHRYLWLQRNVDVCDVRTNAEFQRRFDGFYRVRRGGPWRTEFFALMERSKSTGIDFAEALRAMRQSTNQIEASFASKLVATLEPSRPVIDKFVLENCELRLVRQGNPDRREKQAIEVYGQLCRKYDDLLTSPPGLMIREMFNRRYPDANISEVKKIDLVLWQVRAK